MLLDSLGGLATIDIEAVRGAVRAEVCRRKLAEFVKDAWHVIEPGVPLEWNWHIDAICEHLEAVTYGKIKKLLINVPPGHMKSLLVSVMWPAWEWIDYPHLRAQYGSYDDTLASRDSGKTRDLINSEWYQTTFRPQWSIKRDSNAKGYFTNTVQGFRRTFGMNGRITGHRGNRVCLPYWVKVTTDQGEIPIGSIVENKLNCKVLAFNHKDNTFTLREIADWELSPGKHSVLISVSNGSFFEATSDHPVFVIGKGYVAASELIPGDKVITHDYALQDMLKSDRSDSFAFCEASERSVLQFGMPKNRHVWNRKSSLQDWLNRSSLQALRNLEEKEELHRKLASNSQSVLLAKMYRCLFNCESRKYSTLRTLWEDSQNPSPGYQKRNKTILFEGMRLEVSFTINEGPRESQVRTRELQRAVSKGISKTGGSHQGEGQLQLPALREDGSGSGICDACPSHRLQQAEQRPGQPDFCLPVVPRRDARITRAASELDYATVVDVREVSAPATVYNLNVSEDHNYFANGILVHNCIDDPLNVKDTFNVGAKAHCKWIFDKVLPSRVNDLRTGQFVVIMQRIADDDLSGVLLQRKGWDYLILPSRFDPERRKTTSIGWTDPRKEKGELLFPVMFPEVELEQLENESLGPDIFAGQYQQDPVREGGARFREEHFRYWHWEGPVMVLDRGEGVLDRFRIDVCSVFATVDVAASEKRSADYTVYWICAVTPKGDLLILAEHRDRIDEVKSIALAKRIKNEWPQLSHFVVEQNGVGLPLIANMADQGLAVRPFVVSQDKMAMSVTAVVRCSLGKVFLPKQVPGFEWVKAARDELLVFPAGEHDDRVTAISLAAISLFENMPTVERATSVSVNRDGSPDWSKHYERGREGRTERSMTDRMR